MNRYPSLRTNAYFGPGNMPSSRNRPWESVEVATRSGASPRLNTVRAGDGLAVGADDPAGEIAAGVDQHDLADVMRLPGLAGRIQASRPGVAPGLDRRPCIRQPGQRSRKTNQPFSPVAYVSRTLPTAAPLFDFLLDV